MTTTPTSAAITTGWCEFLAKHLPLLGVEMVVVCPGYRDAPLALAIENEPRLTAWPHPEERSASFLALGWARQSGKPAAVLTTSGSAVANCLPAITEAAHAGVPLLVISANREPSLQASGAPQTMQQAGIFSSFAPSFTTPLPDLQTTTWHRGLRQMCGVADILTRHQPCHLDIPLAPPLDPSPHPWTPPTAPRWQDMQPLISPARSERTVTDNAHLCRDITTGRGLIVVGCRPGLAPESIMSLARITGYPVLADAPSGLRSMDIPDDIAMVSHADAILQGTLADDPASHLIRCGEAPLARPVWEYCQRHRGPVIRLDDRAVERDFCHHAFRLACDLSLTDVENLAKQLPQVDSDWQRNWQNANHRAQLNRDRYLPTAGWCETTAVARVLRATADSDLLMCANSLAIRHTNLVISPNQAPRAILANRGLNGIDGQIATFCGALRSLGPDATGWLLSGDLAALHDLPALAAAQTAGNGTIVIIDNHGGAIFDAFPLAAQEAYQRTIRQPVAWSPAAVCHAFGIPTMTVGSLAELQTALQRAADVSGIQVIVLDVDSDGPPLAEISAAMSS